MVPALGLQDADSHDVAQSVLIQFMRSAGRFQYDRSRRFRGWLYAVAQTSRRRLVRRHRPWDQGVGGFDDPTESIEARDDLAALIERSDARDTLRAAMERVRRRVEP